MSRQKQFYSYLWLREDGTPYYAGKGSGRRAYDRHNGFYPPKDRSRIIVFPMDSEELAFESERALIELFGRKDLGTGILRNLTDGGEGVAGRLMPEQERLSRSGKKRSLESRRKQSASTRGVHKSPEHVKNQTLAKLGRKRSPELCRKLSVIASQRVFKPLTRCKMRATALRNGAVSRGIKKPECDLCQ